MKSPESLIEISDKISGIFGLQFKSTQFQDLERRLKQVARELNIGESIADINSWLSKSSFSIPELNVLSAYLTVGETYFFREKAGLELFRQEIVPQLVQRRKGKDERLRIWCAGCSSGEEPYTLAMILMEHFPQLLNWNITILATDISVTAIQKALRGEYTEWSFRETPLMLKTKYFTPSGKNWEILPEIKKMVTFSYLNLSGNSYPTELTNTTEMDVVFCRNVMMYFTPEVINEVSRRFYHSITEDGWLITSQVELNDAYFSLFDRVRFEQGIFYRKTDKPKEALNNSIRKSPGISTVAHNPKQEVKKETFKKPFNPEPKQSLPDTKYPVKIPLNSADPDTLYRKGQYLKCIESCLQLIANGNLDYEIFALLVKSYANAGLLHEGKEMVDRIISDNRSTSEMYYIYASFLKEQSEETYSELMLRKALYLNHRHLLSHLMLGELLVKRDQKQLAIRHYKTALGLLEEYRESEVVPESDGITVGGIKALTISIINKL